VLVEVDVGDAPEPLGFLLNVVNVGWMWNYVCFGPPGMYDGIGCKLTVLSKTIYLRGVLKYAVLHTVKHRQCQNDG
jgi:hypothetical protein